jgi:hypothetical protein
VLITERIHCASGVLFYIFGLIHVRVAHIVVIRVAHIVVIRVAHIVVITGTTIIHIIINKVD